MTGFGAHMLLFKGYHGAAVGKGRQLAKTELEKLKLSELTTREAVIEAARMCAFPALSAVLTLLAVLLSQHISRP